MALILKFVKIISKFSSQGKTVKLSNYFNLIEDNFLLFNIGLFHRLNYFSNNGTVRIDVGGNEKL